jgi:hypothetical protein
MHERKQNNFWTQPERIEPLFPAVCYSPQATTLLTNLSGRERRVVRNRVAKWCKKNFSRVLKIVSKTGELVIARIKDLAIFIQIDKSSISVTSIVDWSAKSKAYIEVKNLRTLASRVRPRFTYYLTVYTDNRIDLRVLLIFYHVVHYTRIKTRLVFIAA